MKFRLSNILKGDLRFWTVFLLLIFVSVIISMSTTFVLDVASSDIYRHFKKHVFFLVVGLLIAFLVSRLNLKFINAMFNLSNLILIGAVILQFITAFFGKEVYEARRWIEVFGFTFQTSELLKVALIIYVAKEITHYLMEHIDLKQLLRRVGIATAIALFPVAINDLSSALLIGGTVMFQLMVAIPSKVAKKLLFLAFVAVFLGVILILIVPGDLFRTSTWRSRIVNFVTNSYAPTDQPIQAKVAIATSSLVKLSPGKSNQRFILQQVFTDYVFSVIIEEYGAIGGVVVLGLYVLLMIFSTKLLSRLKRVFPAMLVVGFTIAIELQAFMHILVNVGLLPVTGQPLPLISLGGSSIIMTSFMIGVIILISRFAKEKIALTTSEPYDYSFKQTTLLIQ